MSWHSYLAPDVLDAALGVDEEGGPFEAHVRTPVEAFLDPNAISLTDFAIFI